MNSYLMVILSDMLMAVNFALSNKYQKIAGVGMRAGLLFNAMTGLFTAIVFLAICKFQITFSLFSVVMAGGMSILVFIYTMIGFHILKNGNMSFYTLFLMSGGMIIPYIWGILFLNEEMNIFRFIGVCVILLSMIISNGGEKKKNNILTCVAVFFLNGFVSVISKLHQVNTVFESVNASEFVFLSSIIKFIVCLLALVLIGKEKNTSSINNLKLMLIFIFSAVVSGISYLLQLIGATSLPATVLYPLVTGGTIILSSFAGMIAFNERPTKRQWIGVGMCFVGTCLFI